MKFTLDWLKDHLDTDLELTRICEGLVMCGLEVEGIENPADALRAFQVAEIISAEPHPEADRLQICRVQTGEEELQIVCGAPNARAGLKTVLAPIGTYVPGLDITIKKGNIRGEASNGMLCAAAELGLSEESDGIMELPADAPVGTSYVDYAGLDDPVIEIAITPNRGDCLGVYGIARDLAAAGFGTLKPLDTTPLKGSYDSPVQWDIKPAARDYAPLVSGRHFKGLTNGPAPDWMARRLIAVGQRPISALVDITNYVMLDLGRPLHAYNGDAIKGDALWIDLAKGGETITALNEKTYEAPADMLIIGDAEGPDDIAGIMGGERTGVQDDSSSIFLEIAIFDPIKVAMAGRQLGLHSDARYRFERGLDASSPVDFAGHIARLILDICGGEASQLVLAGAGVNWMRQISFNPAKTIALTGVDVAPSAQAEILEKLGFLVDQTDASNWQVQPPSWRNDIDGAADLVEEIIRIAGYDKLPMVSLPKTATVARPAYAAHQLRAVMLRRHLAAEGLMEAVTFSFMKSSDAAVFGGGAAHLHLANPISADLDCMRPSILPNLLQATGRNLKRGEQNIRLFEVGPVFAGTNPEDQHISCAALYQGQALLPDWQQSARSLDVFDAKSGLMDCLALLGLNPANLQITADAPEWFHPGQSGVVRLGKKPIAIFGRLHPSVEKWFDVKGPIFAFEFNLDDVPASRKKGAAKPLLTLNPLQAVSRDFAFILNQDVSAEALLRAVRGADKTHISDVSLFDLYAGDRLQDGQKSLAVKVTLQPQKSTFSEDDLNQISEAVIAAVAKHCGGVLRA